MKYMLLHAVDESRLDNLPPQIEGELEAWVEEMVGRRIELDGARLHPIVRRHDRARRRTARPASRTGRSPRPRSRSPGTT